MFGEKVYGGGRPFQILNGCPPLLSCALLGLDVVLNVNEQTDISAALPGLPGGARASSNPRGNGFFRVIGAQGFEPGEPHFFCQMYLGLMGRFPECGCILEREMVR